MHVLCVMCNSIAALSGLVIGRLRYCVKASRGLPNRKHLGLIAERLSAIILRRISEIVCMYVEYTVPLVQFVVNRARGWLRGQSPR